MLSRNRNGQNSRAAFLYSFGVMCCNYEQGLKELEFDCEVLCNIYSPSPVARRATRFSCPPDSAVPPPSYNNVPPPMNKIELAETGASGWFLVGLTGQQFGAEQLVTVVPDNKVGLVIGKGGETIKNMQARTGLYPGCKRWWSLLEV